MFVAGDYLVCTASADSSWLPGETSHQPLYLYALTSYPAELLRITRELLRILGVILGIPHTDAVNQRFRWVDARWIAVPTIN